MSDTRPPCPCHHIGKAGIDSIGEPALCAYTLFPTSSHCQTRLIFSIKCIASPLSRGRRLRNSTCRSALCSLAFKQVSKIFAGDRYMKKNVQAQVGSVDLLSVDRLTCIILSPSSHQVLFIMRCSSGILLAGFVTLAVSTPVKNEWPTTANWPATGGWPHQSPSATLSSTPSVPTCSGYFEPTGPPYLNDLAQAAGKLYLGSATDQPVCCKAIAFDVICLLIVFTGNR